MSSRVSLTSVFISLMIMEHFISFTDGLKYFCQSYGNYTNNSTYQANLNTALSSLSTNVDQYGFYNTSVGQNPDTVNSIALCRGDVQLDICRSCIRNITVSLFQQCPNQMRAIYWDQYCMVRYSNEPIVGTMETSPAISSSYTDKVIDPSGFMKAINTLVDNLRVQAVTSLHKVAGGNLTSANSQPIYALVQCTPDLSSEDCNTCLLSAYSATASCCSTSKGVYYYMPSCVLYYEVSPFFNETRIQEITPPLPSPSESGKGQNNSIKIIIISLPIFATMLLVSVVGVLVHRNSSNKKDNDETNQTERKIEEGSKKPKDEVCKTNEGPSDMLMASESMEGTPKEGRVDQHVNILTKTVKFWSHLKYRKS